MAAFVFSEAAGKWAAWAALPATGDKFVWILFQSSGLESDALMRDRDTIAALITAGNTEATFTGYSRQDASSYISLTDDDANNAQDLDITTDPSWSPTQAQALGKIVLAYDPDGTNTNSSMVPMFADDFSLTTPTSGTITYQVNASGVMTAVAS